MTIFLFLFFTRDDYTYFDNFFMMKDDFSLTLFLPGYYYDLDESYDESDEEEVKAHLRRVTKQPPLQLDTSSEVHKHHFIHTYEV